MRKTVVISISLTILLLIITILSSTISCASPEPENVFTELLGLLPASAGEDGCFFLIDNEILWDKVGVEFPSGNVSQTELYRSVVEKMMEGFNPDPYPLNYSSFYTGWGLGTGWPNYRETPIQNKYVGYDITNINAEINNLIQI